MKFTQLELMPEITRALEEEGYAEPSPIQERSIPPALEGRDVLGCAQTGTGKTAAFAVPILQRLVSSGHNHAIRALVLTPTRELALQIGESFQTYGKFLSLSSTVIFGGVSPASQAEQLRKNPSILIATPGRLNDFLGQGLLSLKDIEIFVLDEADRMLDMGFWPDVKKVIGQLPQKKQTLFFSATMPPEILDFANSLLVSPVRVSVAPQATPVEAIAQSVYFVDKPRKSKLLIHLLQDPTITSALVFTRTKHGADRVVRDLTRAGIRTQAIHGNKSQTARQQALGRFKSGELRVLVATDIAARGIDIEELSHVINYDLPNIPETYVHRIGRTGRAGASGTAISFCCIDEKPYLVDIEKLTRQKIPEVKEHPFPMEILEPHPPQEKQKGRGNPGTSEQRKDEKKGKNPPAKHEGSHADQQKSSQKRHKRGAKPAEKEPCSQETQQAPSQPLAEAPARKPVGKGTRSHKEKPHKDKDKGSEADLLIKKETDRLPKPEPQKYSSSFEPRPHTPEPRHVDFLTEKPLPRTLGVPQKFVPSQGAVKRPCDQPLSNRHLDPIIKRKG